MPVHIFTTDPNVDYTLPRIMCLHGGGTNAEVFKAQCRALIYAFEGQFRLVFAEGPCFAAPHPDIVDVYGDWGPFRRWTSWLPEHERPGIDEAAEWVECRYAVQTTMEEDERMARAALGSDTEKHPGPWVGLVGFSQGGKIAASLLYEVQESQRLQAAGKSVPATMQPLAEWRWAVLMAARAPFVGTAAADLEMLEDGSLLGQQLLLPTIHVHGLEDEGLPFHQNLYHHWCAPESSLLIEWDGAHRVVLKSTDVKRVVDAMMTVHQTALKN